MNLVTAFSIGRRDGCRTLVAGRAVKQTDDCTNRRSAVTSVYSRSHLGKDHFLKYKYTNTYIYIYTLQYNYTYVAYIYIYIYIYMRTHTHTYTVS